MNQTQLLPFIHKGWNQNRKLNLTNDKVHELCIVLGEWWRKIMLFVDDLTIRKQQNEHTLRLSSCNLKSITLCEIHVRFLQAQEFENCDANQPPSTINLQCNKLYDCGSNLVQCCKSLSILDPSQNFGNLTMCTQLLTSVLIRSRSAFSHSLNECMKLEQWCSIWCQVSLSLTSSFLQLTPIHESATIL